MIGKQLSPEPLIHENCSLVDTQLGAYTEIGAYNTFENVRFGDYSYTGPYCILQNTEAGKFSNIAAMVRIGPTNHPMDRPTQHHFTYRRALYGFCTEDDKEFFSWRAQQKVMIGHDTWIGHGAILMPGVKIGNGAVVGSGAVVTKDVEPYAIVVGIPASPIRKRFDEEIIRKLERIQWWDWPYETIKARLEDFSKPAAQFAALYENKAGD